MGSVILSICIPTVPPRESLLSRLLFTIQEQQTDEVEVLVYPGRDAMGDKLNAMYAAASGTYVVAVDDDDLVADDYCHTVPDALGGIDFLGYKIACTRNGRWYNSFTHRPDLDPDAGWDTTFRGVTPKCPVRADIARAHRFGNEYTADRSWSQAVARDVHSWRYLDRHLYTYCWDTDRSVGTQPDDERHGREQLDVGVWPYDPGQVRWLG